MSTLSDKDQDGQNQLGAEQESQLNRYRSLASKWEERARKKFKDAESETNTMGRRLIEHGAMCYANAAHELRQLLGD